MNVRTRRRLILSASVAGAFLLLALGGVLGRSWYRSHQASEGRREGLELFAAGDFEQALPRLSLAARDTDDVEVLLALAEARMAVSETGNRHLRVAAGMFNHVQSIDPSNLRALRGALECGIALGYLTEVPLLAEKLLAQDGDSVRAREAIMEVRAAQGKWQEVIRLAQELQALQPTAVRWRAVHLSALAAEGADAEGRLELARKWQSEFPNDAGIALLIADVLQHSGRVAQARTIYEELAQRGVTERALLAALLEGLDATGLSSTIDQAIAASIAAHADPNMLAELEGERLLRAGRLEELRATLSRTDSVDATMIRLKCGVEYLAGDRRAAKEALLASTTTGTATTKQSESPFLSVARIALSEDARRERIERIKQSGIRVSSDPLLSIMVSDLALENGEFDAALATLQQSFDLNGRNNLPVGLRAVRLAALMGRIPDALAIARDLGVLYPRSGAVAAAILEAWASALEAGYVPSRVYGALGSDSPERLAEYWESLGSPPDLGALVAEVLARRGLTQRARVLVDQVLAGECNSQQVLKLLHTAELIDPDYARATLETVAKKSVDSDVAIEVARRYETAGRVDDAVAVLRRASAAANDAQKRPLDRMIRTLTAPKGGSNEWFRAELVNDPSMETASFVLSRDEVWSVDPAMRGTNAEIVALAIAQLRSAAGADSLRAAVAEATMNLVFYPTDAARSAASLAALSAAERASPNSVSVLTTYARLLEVGSPPDPLRAAELLRRAVALAPGSAELYPDLVRVLQQIGDYTGAIVMIETYGRLMGNDVSGARRSASMLESQGRFSEAATLHSQLAQRTRATIDRLAHIRTRIRLGETDGIEASLHDLIREDQSVLAIRELVQFLAREGKVSQARSTLEDAAATLASGGTTGLTVSAVDQMRAELEFAYGDQESAIRTARAAAAHGTSQAATMLLGRVLLRAGEIAEARAIVIDAITNHIDDPDVLPLAAMLLVGDRSPEARAALRAALTQVPEAAGELGSVITLLDEATTKDGVLAPSVADLRTARELTVRYSASALVWRLAVQLYGAAGQADEAARLAILARTRLPADESIAQLAVTTCMQAGRFEDASAAASAWRTLAGANTLAADTASAMVNIFRRSPELALAALSEHAKAIMATPSADDALATYVAASVLEGKADSLAVQCAQLEDTRRAVVLRAWLEAAQVLEATDAAAAVNAAAAFAGTRDAELSRCVAVWTELCKQGHADACASATRCLATLGNGGIPLALLQADLAAATGDETRSIALYEGLCGDKYARADADLTQLALRLAGDVAERANLEANPVAIAAMNNLAEFLITTNADLPRALGLARCVSALMPESGAVSDTLVRALSARGELSEARERARQNTDRLLGSIELAEIELRAQNASEAQRALIDAETYLARVSMPARATVNRVESVRDAIAAMQTKIGAEAQ